MGTSRGRRTKQKRLFPLQFHRMNSNLRYNEKEFRKAPNLEVEEEKSGGRGVEGIDRRVDFVSSSYQFVIRSKVFLR